MKGESREEEEGEGGGGSILNSGGGRSERRLEIWQEKVETMEVMTEGEGIGRRLSQLMNGIEGGSEEVGIGGDGQEEGGRWREEGMRAEAERGKCGESWGG